MRKEYAKLRRRPFLTPLWLTVTVALFVVALLGWLVMSASTTTVFVTRHAETAAAGEDPPLSREGQLRAERLRDVFTAAPEGLGLDAIVVSGLRRTQETARPLAAALGIPVIVMPAADAGAIARRVLADFRGGRVLVIGHSNTVPAIVKSLSGRTVPAMAEADFSTLYIIARPRFSPAAVSVVGLP